ncbi:cytochrome P450 [uncultured Tateyamaria sp.]|uniref:cytochrome P450 n=1 Tax=uncultured Tateyamaria sp. TaxID=455651 RepID=UPI0026300DE1|nr:cytochrome P450 [uncultured Tateyamaria sp.]
MKNLADHDSFVDGVPHGTFAQMRAQAPLHWTPDFGADRGFWSLTRYADIMAAQKDPQTFSSAQGIRIEDQSRAEYLARRTFQETDPPEHSTTRRVVNPAFAKPVMAGFEPMIRDLARDIVSQALDHAEFDGVEHIAKRLPMLMLGRILGVPDADLDWLVERGDALIGNTDPEFTTTVIDKVNTDDYAMMPFRSPAGVELYDYAEQILNGTREVDDAGILARVLRAEGGAIQGQEFKNFFCLLVAAGNDTTRYSIAMALWLLSQQKELLEQLQSGAVWDTCADEFIRLASPTLHFRRTATRDVEMHGETIKAGDKVLMWFVSGSRDEAVFDAPDTANLARSPNRHLAFGQGGPHVCLGMWLAKLELKVVLQELVPRITALEATSAPTWTRSNFICGVKSLTLRPTLK